LAYQDEVDVTGFTCRVCKNWRTTLAGVGAIMAAIGDMISQAVNNDWDATRLGADFSGLFTGCGLIFARDSAVSEQEHHEDRRSIQANKETIADVQQDAVVAKEVAEVAAVEVAAVRTLAEDK
jgi:hypothetical protein